MNRIKRISSIILAIVLSLGMAFRLDISEVFAENTDNANNNDGSQLTAPLDTEESKIVTVADASNVIYMDLAAGNIIIDTLKYTGSIFVNGEVTEVTGTHLAENKYYIYQSNNTNVNSPCYFTKTGYETTDNHTNKTNLRIPQYPRVKYTGNGENKTWTDYITNNIDVKQVSRDWETYAPNSDRSGTGNNITFLAGATYDVTLDNIWSTYHEVGVSRKTGGITAHLGSVANTNIQLKLKGDSRFGSIHYYSFNATNKIAFYNGESDSTSGSVTVADFPSDSFNTNYWNAAIGGADSTDSSMGIVIESGVIYSGTTAEDNCTAIGGGGNGFGGVTISGGTVTAVAATTGTAIGGGIGWSSQGGDAYVTISGGTVYAYNLGVCKDSPNHYSKYVPAAAIGGGSSERSNGNKNTTVIINGGTVYAQSMGGSAIGGGGSALKLGGGATVEINGGNVIAKSTTGKYTGTDKVERDISAGVSIGGGTGDTGGGSVKLNISGGKLRTGSIGGGKTTGTGNTGSANVTISGGDIVGQVVMAGGTSDPCSFTMKGGTIHGVNVNSENGYTITDTDLVDPQKDIPIKFQENNGGAVWMDDTSGKTTITDGTIKDCSAGLGGAIYMTGGTVDISGGTIQNCSATSGGAIYMTGGSFTISGKGAINSNTATADGGGVYIGGGSVKVQGGTINNNTASQDGAGMYLGNGTVEVSGGAINMNTATRNGGGVYVAGNFSMTGGEIKSNKAVDGGGIYVNNGTVTMGGGVVDLNTATESGGGMYVSGGTVEVSGGTIQNCSAKSGGAIYMTDGTFTISETGAINNNTATIDGGGVYVGGGTVKVQGGTISTNTASQDGAGMYLGSGTVDVSGGAINENTATRNGGGAYVAGNFSMTGGEIKLNKAINGGGIYVNNGTVTMGGGRVDSNTASQNGGGISVNDGTVTMNGGVVDLNTATENGGGIYISSIEKQASVDISNGSISSNTAKSGGAVYMTSGTFTISGTGAVNNNKATVDGGGMYVGGGTVDVQGGTISNNTATVDGGGMYVGNGTVDVTGGAINENTATRNGGGAYVAGNFSMTDGEIVSNEAVDGGGIYVNNGTVEISGGVVDTNTATENGGGMFVNDGTVDVSGGTIQNCSATSGGAIYMTDGTFTISGTGVIKSNNATTNGGGAYVGGGTVNVTGGTISNNTATVDGGGMYVNNGTVTMGGGKIDSNTATVNGGGMYVGSGAVKVKGGTISNNIASQDGGGAYIAGDFSMTNGEIISNDAVDGGGIYVNDGTVTMYGGRVDLNTATESGGGMYISSTNKPALVDIFSGSISNNTAKTGGGVSVVSTSNQTINVTVGVNCVHPDLNAGSYTAFNYPTSSTDTNDSTGCGEAHNGHTNHIDGLTHSSCPIIENNNALGNGGGFFLKSPNTKLVFYCVIERGNVADGKLQCYDMDVQGGSVEIGDKSYHDADTSTTAKVKGNIVMRDSILVEGGKVDIYGTMENPQFTDDITVEITQNADHFIDHREVFNDTSAIKHYKVHYYENFTGNDGETTGTYVARDYPDEEHLNADGNDKYKFTIMSSLFSRPGYKIVGWNSKPDGSGDTYIVNNTYNLAELAKQGKIGNVKNSAGQVDESLLVLYAVWVRSGYVLQFNPNIADGQTYTGTMPNQRVTVGILDGSQKINKNQFKRSEYIFLGWAKTPTPTEADTIYVDEWQITADFTQVDGSIVILYAQWKICTHVDYLTYTSAENVLTQSCPQCGNHSATATLSALNWDYDGNEHKATLKYSDGWLGEKPAISYKLAANAEWDSEDTIDDNWTISTIPLHAGSYTASITAGDVTAKIEYVINRIQWETPDIPQISFKVEGGKNVIQVTKITKPEGATIEYLIKCLKEGVEETVENYPNWSENNKFIDVHTGYYYYFYAKASADRDHIESVHSKSEIYLSDGGNFINIVKDQGIKVVSSTGTGAFEFTVSVDTGYHFRNYTYNSKIEVVPDSNAALNTQGVTISDSVENGVYKYTVSFASGTSYQLVTLEFRGVAKNTSVSHKVTDGQVFGEFYDGDITISRDSAFTAQFRVNDYIPDEYTSQELKFSQALPLGTTIILKSNNKYWYYKLTGNVTSIGLTDFTAMGQSDKFTLGNDATAKSFICQFIVDFSQTENNALTESLQVTLNLTAKTGVPSISVDDVRVSLGIAEEAKFTLVASENGDSATITGTYTASTGKASIWNDRNSALVLTAPSSIPADAKLTAVVDGATTRYSMNSNKQFIIPQGELGNKQVSFTLNSLLFTSTAQTFTFDAEWYVSESDIDNAPLNGKMVASCEGGVDFTCKKDAVPSVKIEGTIIDATNNVEKHVYKVGEQIEVKVNFAGIPNDAKVVAYLQGVVNGVYTDSGDKKNVETDGQTVQFNISKMPKGSYRILVRVELSGANILELPYYFVIV